MSDSEATVDLEALRKSRSRRKFQKMLTEEAPAQYIYSCRPTGFKLNKLLPAVLGLYVDKIPPLSDV